MCCWVVEQDSQVVYGDLVPDSQLFGKVQWHPSALEFPVATLDLPVCVFVDLSFEYPGSLGLTKACNFQDLGCVDPVVVASSHQWDVIYRALVDINVRIRRGVDLNHVELLLTCRNGSVKEYRTC